MLHRPAAKMSQPMQSGKQNSIGYALLVGLKQARSLPMTRQSAG